MAETPSSPYLVLARKYRPRDFSTLVGQDAMVQTLGNAFAQNRIHHAFIMWEQLSISNHLSLISCWFFPFSMVTLPASICRGYNK